MKDIFKILFKYKFIIVLILILLVVQAFLDLSLPYYTSNIVDVGIANKGIDSNIPNKLRRGEYDKFLELVSDKDLLESSYECNDIECTLIKESEDLSEVLLPVQVYFMTGEDYSKFSGNESLVISEGINYVIREYEELGIDLGKITLDYIVKNGLVMMLLASGVMIVSFMSVYLVSKVMANFCKDLRVSVLSKIMSFEGADRLKFSSSSLITRSTNDVMQITMLVLVILRIVVYAPILGIGALTKVSSSGVSYVILIPIVAILLIMLGLFLIVIPKVRVFQDLLDRVTVVSREILSGVQVIRAFNNQSVEEERFEKENNVISKTSLFVDRGMAVLNPLLTFVINAVTVLIVFVSTPKIDSGLMGVGEMMAVSTYVMQISMAFLMISMVFMMIPRSIVSMKRISEIFNTKSSVQSGDKYLDNIESIEFVDVSFKYGESDNSVLKNISFSVKKGESIGIIGGTGSGKSTLVNLILRFYDTTSGTILINGCDIREYDLKKLRECISYVPQKSWLSSGSIKSNICYGESDIDIEEMVNASRVSMAEEFILNKENNYDEIVSDGGSNVSGGQRQRLSIARAVIKDSSVLILDDASSALDYKTEASVRKNINEISDKKILFVVAQRISAVMHLDKIIVIDDGRIVGVGKHEELLKTSIVYKEISDTQLEVK